MDNSQTVARQIIQKDNVQSDRKTASIRDLMMCARLTPEGGLKFESEIEFYQSKKAFNKKLIEAGDEALIRAYAISLAWQVLSAVEIPSSKQPEDQKNYQEIVGEYQRFLSVLLTDF